MTRTLGAVLLATLALVATACGGAAAEDGDEGLPPARGEEEADEQFLADQARAQLRDEKLFARVTASITVSDAEVRGHFDDNAKTLYTGRTFESLRETLQSQLRSAKRNAAWSKWLEQVEREYASKLEYGEGFEPTG